ncbi:MAG TPA: 16S rRNA (cytidine(1402)-2'-O)-methyltransferase [Devosia sp.]|nr:16S rRNA (cytidine(1402)-2'-O)-methyltransferase [Devosia sp.]
MGEAGTGRYLIAGAPFEAPPLAPGLYVVATPIGNLRDITIRALETLAACDVVLCEDTRTSAKLLDHYDIRTPRSPLHEHNERARIDGLLADLAAGKRIALISDAGTPLISDPGFPLVRAAQDAGAAIFAIPGASALLSALSVAGLPTDSFGFHGFLPQKAGARNEAIAGLASHRETLVFYESPRRLVETLRAMSDTLGYDRPAAVALELTKRFERVYRGTLASLVLGLEEMDEIKGEAVILVGGAIAVEIDPAAWRAALAAALEGQPLRAAVDEITEAFGLKRKDVYDAALAIKAENT